MKKVNYFYVDEAGDINGTIEKFFIHGCIKTDTPIEIENFLLELKKEIDNDFRYYSFYKDFIKDGFHACENHPDIRTKLYKKLFKINFRVYFVLIFKNDSYFSSLCSEKKINEIFQFSLRKLIYDRIIGNKNDENYFFFEDLSIKSSSLKKIIDNIKSEINPNILFKTKIVDKKNENLAIIDYLNYIIYSLLKEYINKKNIKSQTNIDNFNLIIPKIGSIFVMNSGNFYSRKSNPITLEKILKEITV